MTKKLLLTAVLSTSCMLASASVSAFCGISADGSADEFKIDEVRSIKIRTKTDGYKGYPIVVFGGKGTTSGAESASSEAILVYPNPVSEYITISGARDEDDVVVTNMQGVAVVRTKGKRVEVSDLASGGYFLTVKNHTVKFIKK